MTTPTLGSLEKRVERLERNQADSNARHEEAESRLGILDGDGRGSSGMGPGNCDEPLEDEDIDPEALLEELEGDKPEQYEDLTPSFARSDDESVEVMSQGEGYCWIGTQLCSTRPGLEVYVDQDDYYWVTTPDIRHDLVNGVCISDPNTLRELADRIEVAER